MDHFEKKDREKSVAQEYDAECVAGTLDWTQTSWKAKGTPSRGVESPRRAVGKGT